LAQAILAQAPQRRAHLCWHTGHQPAGPMVKVKKNLKAEAMAAKSPKMSPKQSPKATPAAEPKKEDKKEAKKAVGLKRNKEKEPKGDAAPVSDEEKARLTKEAVEVILKGIAKPDVQEKGAFVLSNWNAKFKDALGGYKKFCSGQTGVLQVAEMEGGNFRVLKHGEKLPQGAAKVTSDWTSKLLGVWNAYCKATPAPERSLETFLAPLPNSIKKTFPEGAAKMSPKVEAAPTGDGGKKRKAKTDDAPEAAPTGDGGKKKKGETDDAPEEAPTKKKKDKKA